MEADARALLADAGVSGDDVTITCSAEMRHVGQGFEISVPVPSGTLSADSLSDLRESFFDSYQKLFERTVRDVGIEAMSWRLAASGPNPEISLNFGSGSGESGDALKGSRQVYFPETGFVDCSVYDRYALRTGDEFAGPAVVEERESTTVIGPGAKVEVDKHLNLICTLPKS